MKELFKRKPGVLPRDPDRVITHIERAEDGDLCKRYVRAAKTLQMLIRQSKNRRFLKHKSLRELWEGVWLDAEKDLVDVKLELDHRGIKVTVD